MGVTPQTVNQTVDGDNRVRLEYNDFIFPPAITMQLSSRPVETSSGRTIKRIDITLTADFILSVEDFKSTAPFATDNNDSLNFNAVTDSAELMDRRYFDILQRISLKGKKLILNGLGFGPIYIHNDPRADVRQMDLNNGPTPKIVNCSKIHNGRALHLTWSIDFSISPCRDKILLNKATVTEFDFAIHYTVNDDGMITRNLYGQLEIANFVTNKNEPKFNIETSKLKEKILRGAFPLVPGFERRSDFTTNPNRTKIQFSITDTEIKSDSPYFPGTVKMDVRHSVSNANSNALAPGLKNDQGLVYDITISGTIEVAPGKSKFWGWNALVGVLRSRLAETDANYFMFFFGITDDIYGRGFTFNISYKTTFNPKEFWTRSKLFSPITRDANGKALTWDDHNKEREKYLGPWGYDGEKVFRPDQAKDTVITICDEFDVPDQASKPDKPTTSEDVQESKPTQETSSLGATGVPKLDPNKPVSSSPFTTKVTRDRSFVSYSNVAHISSDFNVAVAGVIGPSDAYKPKDTVTGANSFPSTQVNIDTIESNRLKTTSNVVQTRGTGTHYLTLEGSAVRVQYPVAIPKVDSIEGFTGEPVLLWEKTIPNQLTGFTADGVPIYASEWKRVYSLPNLGSKVRIAAVPSQYMGGKEFILPRSSSSGLNQLFS